MTLEKKKILPPVEPVKVEAVDAIKPFYEKPFVGFDPDSYKIKTTAEIADVNLIPKASTKFVYDEDKFAEGLMAHIASTHKAHYSGGIQTVEFIMENAESLDYLKGNVVKYIQRFGKKDGNNIVDLYKAIHYVMMMAYYADKKGMTKK